MARASRFIAVVLAIAGGGLAAAAPKLVRDRVRHAALTACADRTTLRCELGGVSLAGDGVLLRGLALRDAAGAPVLRVARASARLSWLRLLLRRTQGVSVRVDGVELVARGALPTLTGYLRPRAPQGARGARRLRVDRLSVEGVTATLDLANAGSSPLALRVRGARASWRRGAPAELRWPDATLTLRESAARSGRCEVTLDDWRRVVDCEGFSAVADLTTLGEASHDLRSLLAGSPAAPASPASPTAGPEAPGAPPRVMVHLRDGSVRLVRGRSELVHLQPTQVDLTMQGAQVQEARVDVGAGSDSGASLNALLHRPADAPWRLALHAVDLPLSRLAPWIPAVPWHGTDRGTLRAQVRLSPEARDGVFQLEGDVAVNDFGLQHPGLAREPVDGLTASLEGRVRIDLPGRRVSSPSLNASINGMRFSLQGWLERATAHTAFEANLQVPQLDCDTPRTALPINVVGPLRGFAFAGTLAANASIRLDTRRLSETTFDFHVDDHCMVSRAGFEASVTRFSGPFVQRAQEPGGVTRAFITGPGAPAWVPLPSISPFVIGAVVTREDGGFYRHRGFSPDEVRGALVRNVSLGRFAFGASTISMQLVKNVFLAREKTLVRKLQEVALTWWLESALDKNSILELYLNVVEFGPGIYGVGPAARYFFGVEPRDLTILQAAYLATLLPAPVPRFAIFQRGVVPMETLQRLRGIARAMVGARLVDPVEGERARSEGLAFRPSATTPPLPGTWFVDPSTTDEAARAMVERAAVRVSPPTTDPDSPVPAAPPEDESQDDSPR
ncbi:MAG: transglycosylase domain-containing protein [Polyangiales bacterium]